MDWRELLRRAGTRAVGSRWSPLRTVVSVRTSEPLVALTFDDGPDPDSTPAFLDVLDAYGARATFFMIGANARRHPGLVAEVAARGHCVANHTDTHTPLPSLSGPRRRAEIRRCEEALSPHGARLFRPPKGRQSVGSRIDALLCGHDVVTWCVDADDWNPHEPAWMASRLLERIGPGRIVLLHDALWDPAGPEAADREPVVRALEMVFQRCPEDYRFVTLPALLERGRAVREPWFRDGSGPAAARERLRGPRRER